MVLMPTIRRLSSTNISPHRHITHERLMTKTQLGIAMLDSLGLNLANGQID